MSSDFQFFEGKLLKYWLKLYFPIKKKPQWQSRLSHLPNKGCSQFLVTVSNIIVYNIYRVNSKLQKTTWPTRK